MAGGRAALAYMADIAAVVLFAAALLALLRTFLGPLPAGAAFLVTGALGLCLRRLMAAYTPPCSWKWGRRACFCRFPLLRPGRGGSRGRKPGFPIRRVWLFALGGLILGLAREFLASGSLFGVELADGVSESFGFFDSGAAGAIGIIPSGLVPGPVGLRERRLFPYTTRDGLRIGVYAALTVLLSAWAAGGLRQVLPASPAFLGDLLALLVTALLVLVGGAVLPRERFFRDGVLTACAALAAVWASRADAAALLWIPAAAAGILALAFSSSRLSTAGPTISTCRPLPDAARRHAPDHRGARGPVGALKPPPRPVGSGGFLPFPYAGGFPEIFLYIPEVPCYTIWAIMPSPTRTAEDAPSAGDAPVPRSGFAENLKEEVQHMLPEEKPKS